MSFNEEAARELVGGGPARREEELPYNTWPPVGEHHRGSLAGSVDGAGVASINSSVEVVSTTGNPTGTRTSNISFSFDWP